MIITPFTTHELENYRYSKEWLIKNFIHVGDCMFIKAQKKVGKSIFAQAMAHAASSGEPLFGEYEITRPLNIAYLFSEGAITDWKDRLINMKKMHGANGDKIFWIQCQQVALHKEDCGKLFKQELIDIGSDFDIIVWDCLYKFLYGGDYNNGVDMGVFNANEETIRNYFNAASIIVHHDTEKKGKTQDGKEFSYASVNNAMGSSVILANATHSYTIERHKVRGKQMNKLILGDSRGGELVEELCYFNVVPEDNDQGALGIKLDDSDVNSNYSVVHDHIKKYKEVQIRGLLERLDLECSQETLRRICRRLEKQKLIERAENEDGLKTYRWIHI